MHSLIGGSHVESNLLNNLNLLEFPWPMISLLAWPSFTAESNTLSTCSPVCALVSWYWELIFCATVSASETDTKLIHPLLQIQNKWDRLLYGGDRNYFMFATMQTWTCIKAVHVLHWRRNSLKDKGGEGGWDGYPLDCLAEPCHLALQNLILHVFQTEICPFSYPVSGLAICTSKLLNCILFLLFGLWNGLI